MSDSRKLVHDLLADLVRRTPSIGSRMVREQSLYSRRKGAEPLNELVAKLSAEERGELALMLQNERTTALFDSLVWLHRLRLQSNDGDLDLESDGYTIFEEYSALLSKVGPREDA